MEAQVKLTKLSSCAGCGAKVGAGTLSRLLGDLPTHADPNLLVGFDRSDDASVYRVSDELALVQTVDFFPPIVDDPFTFGQIAATNALSDVYAMGGEPKLALNLLCVPEKMPQSAVKGILAGGYSKVFEAGAIITGGHSIFDEVPKYGLSVTGFVHPDRFFKNLGAREGDVLFLTKPLGTGILTTAEKAEMLELGEIDRAITIMTTLNRGARDCAVCYRVHACTDVTGFSLMGHMLEMMQGSDVSARVETGAIDFLPRVLEFANMGLLPAGVYRNRAFAEPYVDEENLPLPVRDALFDPQTSGGLLLAVDPKDADAMERDLKASVPSAQRIGTVLAKGDKSIYLI
ncbi:MAG: selenide, water dikinase SelD [Eubacteriales bacterium]|nr:selenide, water dikinase SelD [Eubacteriales bacterium]